jgi:hypothetical protein
MVWNLANFVIPFLKQQTMLRLKISVVASLLFYLIVVGCESRACAQSLDWRSHIYDSLLVHVAQAKLDSLLAFHKLNPNDVRVVASSDLLSLTKSLSYTHPSASDILRIGRAGATVTFPENSVGYTEHIVYRLEGDIISKEGSLTIPFVVVDSVDARAISSSELSTMQYGKYGLIEIREPQPTSFWDRILQPAAVIVGAGVIVALFFIIRS